MLTTSNEVDMTEVMALRERYRDSFEKAHGVKLGFMSTAKACIVALKEIPAANAEIDGDDIVYEPLRRRHRRRHRTGPRRAGGARRRPAELRRHRKARRRSWPPRARRQAGARGTLGRHLHDHQWRRLWLAPVDIEKGMNCFKLIMDKGAINKLRIMGRFMHIFF